MTKSSTPQTSETTMRYRPESGVELKVKDTVGQPLGRVDGPLKLTGEATYTAEYPFENATFAALVYSTTARGKIARIDPSAAERSPGVLVVMTYQNAPRMQAPALYSDPSSGGVAASNLPVMQGDEVAWNGQPVAVVVAETQDQAEHAASLVKVEYQAQPAALSFDALKEGAQPPPTVMGEPSEIRVGDAEAALRGAPARVDATYRTPRESPSAIELHATAVQWTKGDDGADAVTIYDTTQSLSLVQQTVAKVFGLKPEQVRVIVPFVGGGFGGKAMMFDNTLLCVAAARLVNRPVKLTLSREGVFRATGWRAPSEQRVALSAGTDGKLSALIHTGTTAVVTHNENVFPEQFSMPARHLYAASTFLIAQKTFSLDQVANCPVRAPGDSIGTFALESAMDELAHELGMDPIELRRVNEPEQDPISGVPFSNRHLLEAYRRGAERFGWSSRPSRSQRDGEWLVGQGVASSYYPYYRFPATARLRLAADGTAKVQAAAHELGMGTATVQIQHAAQRLGLPVGQVSFGYGDSTMPTTYIAGGSSQTASLIAAVSAAIAELHKALLMLVGPDSPLSGLTVEQVEAREGGLYRVGAEDQGESYIDLLRRAGQDHIEVAGTSAAPSEIMEYSMHSYGAQFCEVRVHAQTGEVRVSRWVGSFDCGKILNAKTASSQFRGAIVMGIGQALTEDVFFDERGGRVMNPSLAEYHVPVHLDVPHLDVLWTDIPDQQAPLGLHGIGEIGVTGAAAAVANAVFNATGKRIRELPITLDKLM